MCMYMVLSGTLMPSLAIPISSFTHHVHFPSHWHIHLCPISFSYEVACEEYSKALGLLHSSDDEEDEGARAVRASQSVIVEFIVNEVCTESGGDKTGLCCVCVDSKLPPPAAV